MKSPSLERFYLKINKSILLAQAFTEVKELEFIIKTCRLKPFSIFYDKEKYSLKLYNHWFDEFGNSLKIIKNKRLKIINNDLILSAHPNICTDLYYGLSISKIVKLSKLVHIIIGEDEDDNDNYFILTFLGIDNYLRSYMFLYNEWRQVSPLMLGIKRLKNIANHTDIKYFHELYNKENYNTPCANVIEWISCMSPSREFLEILKKRHDVDFSNILEQDLNDQ